MSSIPLVSIIIPVYNVENYLEECLNSVLSQSYDNIEFIIINDGSTDNSREIILDFLKIDNRIIFVDNSNNGVGTSRNIGLKKASGDYILFIDSDDYVDKHLVNTLLESVATDDICIYDAVSFEDTTGIYSDQKYFVGLSDSVLQKSIENNTYQEYLFFYISPCLKLYTSSFLKQNDIYFPEGIYGEDVLFWLKCLLATNRIKYVDYLGYYRRYRRESIMTAGSTKNLKDRIGSVPELFTMSKANRNLQIKVLIYALDCWFSVYDIKNKELHKYTNEVFDSFSLKGRMNELNPPIDLKLRYFLLRHTNKSIINIYKYCFYNIYIKLKKAI